MTYSNSILLLDLPVAVLWLAPEGLLRMPPSLRQLAQELLTISFVLSLGL